MALTITTANAAENNTNRANFILPYCKLTAIEVMDKAENALVHGRCVGIIQGIELAVRVSYAFAAQAEPSLPRFCADIPTGITLEQLTDVVIRYGDTHPEQTHLLFPGFVVFALRDAWPCKK